MADKKISALTELAATPSSGDFIAILDTSAGSTKKVNYENLAGRIFHYPVFDPQTLYAARPQIFFFLTPYAITITSIYIAGNDASPTTELLGDLKFADDMVTGSFANATVIDVCDTTSGYVSITSGFDDATVPAGKFIYFEMDASPHVDWKDFLIQVTYKVD